MTLFPRFARIFRCPFERDVPDPDLLLYVVIVTSWIHRIHIYLCIVYRLARDHCCCTSLVHSFLRVSTVPVAKTDFEKSHDPRRSTQTTAKNVSGF